ncbi:MAG: DUF2934 domain-containing protein [Rhodospirillales bacterium]|nr:DUF2934 domain-containing protein [Rhodospirillales bacterium]
MSKSLHKVTHDLQVRIQEIAYMMWESAGRQQGMALEYWLAAEKEVLATFQAAAERMMPATKTEASSTVTAVPTKQSTATPIVDNSTSKSEPTAPKPAKPGPSASKPEPAVASASDEAEPRSAEAKPATTTKTATKPASRRTTSRGRAKADPRHGFCREHSTLSIEGLITIGSRRACGSGKVCLVNGTPNPAWMSFPGSSCPWH